MFSTCPLVRPFVRSSVTRFVNTIGLLLVKFIKHNQNYYQKLDVDVSTSVRGLYQKKLVLSSSSS